MSGAATRPLPEWAREASLGIFVHWGPYSVPAWAESPGAWGAVDPDTWFAHNGYAEWYANTIRIEGSPAAQHQADAHGGRPYDAFVDAWRAEEYDPVDWARLFRDLGADYVVPVAKHHDGIALWDAPGAEERSTAHRGPRGDLIAPLADAVRAEGMRFGVYYSGGLDWAHSAFPPITSMEDVERWRPVDADYARYATAHVRDLVDRYRPSVIWNDIDWPDAGKADGSLDALIRHYRAVVPDGIVNDRWGGAAADYRTSEYAHDAQNESGVGWEHNRGLGFSFGYNAEEDPAHALSPRGLARLYADVVSRGGRLLLNVGPDAAGRIPACQRRTLEGAAAWLRAVKPWTASRRSFTEAEAAQLPDAGWSCGWMSRGRPVVVAEAEPTAVRIDGVPATVFVLPADDAA
ncbi:alpha-L-fucosidase [Microbacterium halophytorum]|uniref:alpha-L-fucosidase n=1 Tax=Microbacterium halophytorum TaxID=2067568 RepID=UPI000CFD6B5A|nr:alpha-L-fucosidase [Microbacterium halophytorum]